MRTTMRIKRGEYMGYKIEEWIDTNGLIKPQAHWNDSGNGILYTAVYLALTNFKEFPLFKLPVQACVWDGLLYRTPAKQFGQEQWDNYLGLAAIYFFTRDRAAARKCIWYGIKHFGLYDTDGLSESKDWLWRFPQVWVLMWLAAFPWLKLLIFPVGWLTGRFMKPDRVDGSGTQLAWLYHFTFASAYGSEPDEKMKEIHAQFKLTSREYYSEGHPTPVLLNS